MAERKFYLMVDSGNEDEPPIQYFDRMTSAVAAFHMLDPQWQRFAWLVERKPRAGNVVHFRDGVSCGASQARPVPERVANPPEAA